MVSNALNNILVKKKFVIGDLNQTKNCSKATLDSVLASNTAGVGDNLAFAAIRWEHLYPTDFSYNGRTNGYLK